MAVNFYKYQGAGNDFIIIDGRNTDFEANPRVIERLCDRRFGIGADGLMIFKNHVDFDFSMSYYNSDGYEGSMCGNGGRCILAFSKLVGLEKNTLKFLAIDGPHEGEILTYSDHNALVKLKMTDVNQIKNTPTHYEINTGSPHYVKFDNNVRSKDVFKEGKAIRNNDYFREKGINVNFAEEYPDHLFVRTYERGVENETLSCGTGVTASALALALKNNLKNGSIHIKTLGGNLKVSFQKEADIFKNIWLEGPATFVFKGEISI